MFVLFLLSTAIMGCTKSNDTTPANPYGGDKGQTTFWASNINSSYYPITVTVNGSVIGEIGGALGEAPDCQQATNLVVKYVAEPGTYNFACTAAGNAGTWTGSITVKDAGCFLAQLQ